jgi:hypothetical protein
MVWARASVLRWRPAFFRNDRIEATDSGAPFVGVDARYVAELAAKK